MLLGSWGIRTRRELAKDSGRKQSGWTVFADVATSVSEAIGAIAPGQNPPLSARKEKESIRWGTLRKEGAPMGGSCIKIK